MRDLIQLIFHWWNAAPSGDVEGGVYIVQPKSRAHVVERIGRTHVVHIDSEEEAN